MIIIGGIKKETADQEFQAGMSVLEEMDESIFNKKPKNEPLDIKPKIEPKEEVIEKDSFGIFEKSTENVNIEGTSEANPEIEANTAETSENVSRKSNIDNVEIDSPPNETYSNNKEFYDWVSIKSYLKSRRNEAKFLNLKELFVKMYPRLGSVKTKNKSIQNMKNCFKTKS